LIWDSLRISDITVKVQKPFLLSRRGLLGASPALVLGANDRVRAALIGCGNRGSGGLLPGALALGVQVAAVCDIYKPHLDRALTVIHSQGGAKPDTYTEYRKVLDRKDIDAVIIATPDHWHAPIAVAACEAGKDVYVEKPLANSIEDCLKIVAAAERTKRIVQVGLQQRSMKIYHDALAMIKDGAIGPVERCSMAWGSSHSETGAPDPVGPPPDGFDWETFQGSAPRRPYRLSRQNSWRNYWEYGSGTVTDFGVHLLDVARWFLALDMAKSCYAAGYSTPGRSPEKIPNAVEAVWKFDGTLVTYSSRHSDMDNTFWGARGTLFVNRGFIRTTMFPERGKRSETKELKVIDPGFESSRLSIPNIGNAAHVRNFLDCVRSRKKPNADVETAFRSTLPCLLAAQAMRTGRACRWDGNAVREI
jgi:predicted dehydrogenase